MSATTVLILFISLKGLQLALEQTFSVLNRLTYRNVLRQEEAIRELRTSREKFNKALAYTEAKFRLSTVQNALVSLGLLAFPAVGGLGWIEQASIRLAPFLPGPPFRVGLIFFMVLGGLGLLVQIPFSYYRTFVLEESFGFNRETRRGFISDLLRVVVLSMILGGTILSLLLWIMERLGEGWWFYAWLAVTLFSFFTVWIFPTLLAPIFNKFSPLPDGETKEAIHALIDQIGFRNQGVFVMDASKRSTHGNAYFTGLGRKKRIVLFDTLIQMLKTPEIVAVLAHELGHFKLHHIRHALWRSTLFSFFLFYLLHLCLPLENFYLAFGLKGITHYGALTVFGIWFGLLSFGLQPVESYLSRRNEFAADRFARETLGSGATLIQALLVLREQSHAMPIVHPLYSIFYYSHPPILERIRALKT